MIYVLMKFEYNEYEVDLYFKYYLFKYEILYG